jgi:hypothetical protein
MKRKDAPKMDRSQERRGSWLAVGQAGVNGFNI